MSAHLDAQTLGRWADGLLAEEDGQRAAAHLAQCLACRARAARQSQTARLLRQLPPETPPPHLARGILAAIDRRRNSETFWRQLAAGSTVAALLGLLLLAVAGADLARLLPALAGAPLSAASSVLDVPADALGALAGSAFDWGSALSGGAGAALLTGLVLLTGAAFGALAQLLRPGAMSNTQL
jgi:predicted anti-sigma-YlaC factor YlaD